MDVDKLKLEKYQPIMRARSFPVANINLRRIHLNMACTKFYNARQTQCELYFDKTQQVVVIQPLHYETVDSINLKIQDRGKGPDIFCQELLKKTDLYPKLLNGVQH